jgi:hypothetical protein
MVSMTMAVRDGQMRGGPIQQQNSETCSKRLRSQGERHGITSIEQQSTGCVETCRSLRLQVRELLTLCSDHCALQTVRHAACPARSNFRGAQFIVSMRPDRTGASGLYRMGILRLLQAGYRRVQSSNELCRQHACVHPCFSSSSAFKLFLAICNHVLCFSVRCCVSGAGIELLFRTGTVSGIEPPPPVRSGLASDGLDQKRDPCPL